MTLRIAINNLNASSSASAPLQVSERPSYICHEIKFAKASLVDDPIVVVKTTVRLT